MQADVSELATLGTDLVGASAGAEQRLSVAVRAAATHLEATAKTLAPVDTGFLRGSIGVTYEAPGVALVGPTAAYGAYVEYGTSRMAGKSYMLPAAEQTAPAFLAAVGQVGDPLGGAGR